MSSEKEKLTNDKKWFGGIFNRSKSESTPEVTVALPTDPAVPTTAPAEDGLMYEKPRKLTFTISPWIENEDLLRDEGVIFGLAESPIQEKLDSISHYYEEKKQFHRLKTMLIDTDINVLKGLISDEKNKIQDRLKDIDLLAKNTDKEYSGLLRNTSGILVFIIVVIGLYRFLYYLLDFKFETPHILAIAFAFLGFFSLGQSVDFLFADAKEAEAISKNKAVVIILDLILPFTLALYIASVTREYISGFECFAASLLLLVVFWLQGQAQARLKIFDFMQTAYIIFRNNIRNAKADKKKIQELLAENVKSEGKIKDLEGKIERMADEKARFLPDDVLEATKQSKMRLFESEYNMARFYKTQNNNTQNKSDNL